MENGEIPFLTTSAKTAVNVEEAFAKAVDAWCALEAHKQPIYTAETVDLTKTTTNHSPKALCCS